MLDEQQQTDQPSILPEAPPTSGRFLSLKFPKWPALALVVVSVTIGVYLFTKLKINTVAPTDQKTAKNEAPQNQLAGWKTYANKLADLGYELRYPPDWATEYNAIISPDKKARIIFISLSCELYDYSGKFNYASHGTASAEFRKRACRKGISIELLVKVPGQSPEPSEPSKESLKEFERYQATLERILDTIRLTEDSTTWKTYQNKKFLFEFKYPPMFKVSERDHYSLIYVDLEKFEAGSDNDLPQTNGQWVPTNFYIFAQNTEQTTDKLKDYIQNKEWQPIQFLGQDALLIGGDSCDKEIAFVNNGVLYKITEPISCSVSFDGKIAKIYETFKVINWDLRSETASWTIYRNEQNGFEFKYPPGWSWQEGPITPDTIHGPNRILVRYTPKKLMPKTKEFCLLYPKKADCEVIKLESADGINAYLYWGQQKIEPPNQSPYFDNYVSIRDGDDNGILIDFFSPPSSKEEASGMIKAVLSTFRFIK